MSQNLPTPEEIARVRAKAAGKSDLWEDFLPSDDELQHNEDVPHQPKAKPISVPRKSNVAMDDAKRLYAVSEAIYKTLIFFNYIVGIAGAIATIAAFVTAAKDHEVVPAVAGIAFALVTTIICFVNYAVAVLSTHLTKVVSNISISLLNK